MISHSGLYAIRATAVLVQVPEGAYKNVRQIAEAAQVPSSYLTKILQTLARAGVLASQKGPGGGFRLARPAAEIALWDLLEPIDDPAPWQGCLLGKTECSETAPCALHEHWKVVRGNYCETLQRTTMADLATYDAREVTEKLFHPTYE